MKWQVKWLKNIKINLIIYYNLINNELARDTWQQARVSHTDTHALLKPVLVKVSVVSDFRQHITANYLF